MKDFENTPSIEIHSDEIQDIISRPPSWLLTWGISFPFLLFAILLALSWLVRYPDVIKVKVVVTSDPAPISLITRTSGKFILLKNENESVKKDELIALVQPDENPEDILYLEDCLFDFENKNHVELFNSLLKAKNARALQSYVDKSIMALQELTAFEQMDPYQQQVKNFKKQADTHHQLNQNLQKQLSLIKYEALIANQQYYADSIRFEQTVMELNDFNVSKTNYLLKQRSLYSMEASIISSQLQIESQKDQATQLSLQFKEMNKRLSNESISSLKELQAKIRSWKEKYWFTAPMEGTLSYLGFLEDGQIIEAGKPVFTILPKTDRLVARSELPVNGAAKVKAGQDVNIRLYNYPYEQFGMLRGQVKAISMASENGNYSVTIDLTQGMISTHNKSLDLHPPLLGEGEIITEDFRLLDRFFYPLKKLIDF